MASAFNYSYDLTSVTIPSSVNEIGRSAFSGCCSGLTSVVSLTKEPVGINIFSNRANVTLYVPKAVRLVEVAAIFLSVTVVTSVTCDNKVFPSCGIPDNLNELIFSKSRDI